VRGAIKDASTIAVVTCPTEPILSADMVERGTHIDSVVSRRIEI
jgi:ornithine cyclodeaminase/alanine dehydrogenase-like protein (mu-crystallin family)